MSISVACQLFTTSFKAKTQIQNLNQLRSTHSHAIATCQPIIAAQYPTRLVADTTNKGPIRLRRWLVARLPGGALARESSEGWSKI